MSQHWLLLLTIIPFGLLTVYLVDLVPPRLGAEAVSDTSQDFALNEGGAERGKSSFCDPTAIKTTGALVQSEPELLEGERCRSS